MLTKKTFIMHSLWVFYRCWIAVFEVKYKKRCIVKKSETDFEEGKTS